MNKSEIISATTQWVRNKMLSETTGHDWWHVYRVKEMALYISSIEGGDKFIIEMASLMHDMGDHKFHNGIDKTRETALYWLDQFSDIPKSEKEYIASICENISFKGAHVDTSIDTIEGKITQDADRLDALGAIGISRAFAYGGKNNRCLHNPNIKPTLHSDFASYRNSKSTTINHFYEKLLLLKDRMQTPTAREIAEKRTKYIEEFLKNFIDEWEFRV